MTLESATRVTGLTEAAAIDLAKIEQYPQLSALFDPHEPRAVLFDAGYIHTDGVTGEISLTESGASLLAEWRAELLNPGTVQDRSGNADLSPGGA